MAKVKAGSHTLANLSKQMRKKMLHTNFACMLFNTNEMILAFLVITDVKDCNGEKITLVELWPSPPEFLLVSPIKRERVIHTAAWQQNISWQQGSQQFMLATSF